MTLSSIYSAVLSAGKMGIEGAIGAKLADEASERIGKLNPLKIISTMMPQSIKDGLKKGMLHQTLESCNIKAALLFNSLKMSSVICAPILEEAVFRAGIQQILTLGLSYGMNVEAAQLASIAITNTIFAMAHDKDLDSTQGTDLWLKSTAFGLSYSQGGYLAAVAAHMINNIRQQYLPSVSELFNSTSVEEDHQMFLEMLKSKDQS